MSAGTKFQCDYPEEAYGSGSGACVEVRGLAASAALSCSPHGCTVLPQVPLPHATSPLQIDVSGSECGHIAFGCCIAW